MRVYENGQDGSGQSQMPIRVVCNRCGKELKLENGILKEGCISADVCFGYFSRRDGARHRFDLCEDCYDEMISRFCVPVETTESTELL
ncbi:MAG: hypothetical protein MRZ49_09035 [Lachnospiraceae bacterium]|nr:hypothetical protein [Lachnospiraceae bacterium]